jgi:hypothetical protein
MVVHLTSEELEVPHEKTNHRKAPVEQEEFNKGLD